MNTMSIEDFCNSNATVQFINALRQYRGGMTHFSCIGRPKRQDILVYLSNCSGRIRTKDGREIEMQENGIYYAPYGSEYVLDVSHQENGSTIGVNFHLVDERGEPFVFSRDVLCFRASPTSVRAFEELARSDSLSTLQSRILLETVIAEFGRERLVPQIPVSISASVVYLREHYTESLTVAQLAAMSYVSEVYFRRVFKQAFGMSPAAYIADLRLKRAAEYLEYGDMSIKEIAETVGYAGASYLTRVFKDAYGITPLHYRKEKTEPR